MATFTTTRSSGASPLVCVTLPISLRRTFTYRLPASCNLTHPIGHRVVVPFAGKLVIGVITSLPSSPPTRPVKEVLTPLDDTPLCAPTHLRFLQWVSDYYLCPLGQVLHAAFASTPVWEIFIEKKIALETLTPTDTTAPFIHALQAKHRLTYTQATSLLPGKELVHTLHTLIQQQAVQLTSPLTPQEPYFSLLNEAFDPTGTILSSYTAQTFTTPAQKKFLHAYHAQVANTRQRWVAQTALLHAGCSPALLTRLEKKGHLLTKHGPLSPPAPLHATPPPAIQASQPLVSPQASTRVAFLPSNATTHAALSTTIATHLFHKKERLLCIAPNLETLTTWQQALTPLLGDKLLLWSSLQSTRDKQLTWHTLRQGLPACLLATPPALLLPFPKVDHLIVIDEASPDHKAEAAPRYHARDAAILYATYHEARVLLTSPTPSLETYHNITQGKYTQLTPTHNTLTPDSIKERVAILTRPRIDHILTQPLIKKLTTAFLQQKKVAILHPRRGYAAYTSCKKCHWQAQCPDCHFGLVYHQTTSQLHCHHCKRTFPPFMRCAQCHATALHYARTGTQELIEACALHFPHARTARIDTDHTPYKKKYTQTLHAFAQGELDCLIGTQRLLRALPSLKPDLIVLVDLPLWSSQGNFRRTEHQHATLHALLAYTTASFLLTTTAPHRHKLPHLLDPTTAFYTQELNERHTYHYPPYHKLLTITLRHPDQQVALHAAHTLASTLTAQQLPHTQTLLGPLPLPTHKNHAQVALWLPHTSQAIKPPLLAATHALCKKVAYKKINIGFNVDPY